MTPLRYEDDRQEKGRSPPETLHFGCFLGRLLRCLSRLSQHWIGCNCSGSCSGFLTELSRYDLLRRILNAGVIHNKDSFLNLNDWQIGMRVEWQWREVRVFGRVVSTRR